MFIRKLDELFIFINSANNIKSKSYKTRLNQKLLSIIKKNKFYPNKI